MIVWVGYVLNELACLSFFEKPVLNFECSPLQVENIFAVLSELELQGKHIFYEVLAAHFKIKPALDSGTYWDSVSVLICRSYMLFTF